MCLLTHFHLIPGIRCGERPCFPPTVLAAAGQELFVVEICCCHALLAEPGAECVHHWRRAAHVDVHVAAIQVARLDMSHHIALARMGLSLAATRAEKVKPGILVANSSNRSTPTASTLLVTA